MTQTPTQPQTTNTLFPVTSTSAAEQANLLQGAREYWVAEFDANGTAAPEDFILLAKLRAGDTGPTPEPVTEDTTYDNGTVMSVQTGVNNGAKTLDIEASAEDPQCRILIDHSRTFGTPQKRGKVFAYIAFNEDRSALYGEARVNTAFPPREGAHRWSFNIVFERVQLLMPSENPIPVAG